MKRYLLFPVVLVFAFTASLAAQGMKKMSKEKEIRVTGEVVDVACYLHQGARGEDHKACAEACAKLGGALGILTKEGKLYVSILPDDHSDGPNAKLMDHIAHEVEAKGYVRSKGGVNGIMITSVAMAK